VTWIDGKGYVVSLLESVNEALPRRVWNGIFAAGDWHAKRGPEGDAIAAVTR
jgi:hypothetical protein